jgi:hypothetical protein
MPRSLVHILLLALAASASAQVHSDARVVFETASVAEILLSASAQDGDTVAAMSLVGGERLVSFSDGRRAVVRRFALTLPTVRVAVSSEVRRSRSVLLAGETGGGVSTDMTAPFDARVVDVASREGFFAATLEAVVALVDERGTAATLIQERSVRLEHDARPPRLASILGTPSDPAPSRSMRPLEPSGAAAGQEWYRMEIAETGLYRIDRTMLRSAGIASELLGDIKRLRLFGLPGTPIPESLLEPRPAGLQEIPRLIQDSNGNGVLDDGDAVIFYGRSVRDWRYEPTTRTFHHTINPYTEKNVVLVTFDPMAFGRDMDSVMSSPGPGVPVTDAVGRIAVDQDRINFVSSGRRWVGEPFDQNDPTSVFINSLPGLVPSTTVNYRAVFFSRSGTVDTFRVAVNDVPVLGPVLMYTSDISSIDQISNYAYESPVQSFSYAGPLPDQRSVLKFTFGARNSSAKGWLDWFEIFYRRSLHAVGDRLLFPGPDTTALLEYTVRDLSSRSTVVFDVTDHANVRRVAGVEFDLADASVCRFRLPQTAGSVRELAVVGPNGFLTPPAPVKIAAPSLRGFSGQARFLIIAPKEFMEEAERLRAHREQRDSLRTLVVDIADIYHEFGGGMPDPMAVRDFLAFARSNYAGPVRYVLFFGSGHFDYRNLSTSVRNWVPPYETAESNTQIMSYASDDYFARLDFGSARISLAIGRLPGRNVTEMRSLVDKIIRYETGSPLDPWRNRITFIADDGQTSTTFEGSLHTGQTEALARSYTPTSFEQRKVYLVEYPTVNTASGRRKPAANDAIIEAYNRGTLIMNFTGHGNPRLWTHEAVFTREGSLPRLTNRDRLTFLVAATCNFAQWDNPAEQSAGEMLLTMPDGGAIGVVTATRSVYSFDNFELNAEFYRQLFLRDATGAPLRVGDAFFAMKQIRTDPNDQKYHLLADPTLRLLQPVGQARIDSVNGVSTTSVSVVPSLGRIVVKGSVRDGLGGLRPDFSGRGILELFDAKRSVTVAEWGGYSFEVQGSVLYRGEVSVASGQFAAQIPVPKDVSFGARARLALYATSGVVDAAGVTEQVTIFGTDTLAAVDTTGPSVEVFVGTTAFRSGDVVPPDPELIVVLSDVNGINTSTVGIGHRLEAELVEAQRTVDLGEYYRGDLDTYQSGRSVVRLSGLEEGRHTVRVRAWDTHNNSSSTEAAFEVRAGSGVDLFHPANFPNPMRDRTVFVFQRTSTDPVSVRVRIFTIAGRLIQELTAEGVTDVSVGIPWDGRDRDGASIANGVYVYKIIVNSMDRSESREFIGKLAVVR